MSEEFAIQTGRALWEVKAGRHETGRQNKRSKLERLKGFSSKYFAGGRVSNTKVMCSEEGAGKMYLEPGSGQGAQVKVVTIVNSSQQQVEQGRSRYVEKY